MTDEPITPLGRIVFRLDVMENVLFDHVMVEPDPADPPRVGYAGGTLCGGCKAPLGTFGPGTYRQLAAHQAMELAIRQESYVTIVATSRAADAPGH